MRGPLLLERLLDGRRGLRVVGDVQGDYQAFRQAVEDARARGLAVLCLGDIVDRGPDSAEAIRTMLDLLDNGDGAFIGGNHDFKFMRWAQGNKVSIEEHALATTIRDLADKPDGWSLARRFAEACAEAPLWVHSGKDFFVHGAFAPEMLDDLEGPSLGSHSRRDSCNALALYAETNGTFQDDGRPVRTYDWVHDIPKGLSVYVGHDVRSTEKIIEEYGGRGGRAVFLDTGAGGKGGKLSWNDFEGTRILADLAIAKRLASSREQDAVSGSRGRRSVKHKPKQKDPLLYILVGPGGSGKTTWAKTHFPEDAILSQEQIREELHGNLRFQGKASQISDIVRARIASRIAHGQVTVIDGVHIDGRARKAMVGLLPATERACYVVIDRPIEEKIRDMDKQQDGMREFLEGHQAKFERRLSDILRGDGFPNVEVRDCRDPLSIMRYQESAGKSGKGARER